MSSVVNSPSSYTYTQLPQDDGTAEAQKLAQQIQAALAQGDTAALQTLGSTATSLLSVLNKAQDDLTTSLASSGLSSASGLLNQLQTVESSYNMVQTALTALDNALGQAYQNGTPSQPFSPSSTSPQSVLPSGSEGTGSSAFNLSFSTASGTGSVPISNSDLLGLLQQDPDILNSLKAYVKGQAQQSLLDAVMNAMGGGSNLNGSQSSNSNSHGKSGGGNVGAGAGGGAGSGGAPALALNPSGGQTTGTTAGNTAPTGTSNSFGASNNGTTGTSSSGGTSNNGTTGTSSSNGNANGLTFTSSPSGAQASEGSGSPTVSSNLQLTQGGAQSGSGNTASVDGWDANLGLTNPGNIDEFLMMVLLACYEDGQKGLEQMAQQLQKTNNQKKQLRQELSGLYNQKTGNEQSDTAVNAQIQNVQGQLSSTSDDAQLQQLQLQNATQNQQQLLQEISSFSKNLYDASMNILRKIGS